MSKSKYRNLWVTRYVRRTEEYLVKVPMETPDDEVLEFMREHIAANPDSAVSTDTHELTLQVDTLATKKELSYFKGEVIKMVPA